MNSLVNNLKLVKDRYISFPIEVKASICYLICSFIQKGISVVTTPIFTRLLSTEEYGEYSVFISWWGIIAILVSMNISYGVYTQGLVKFSEDRKRFIASLQGLNTTLVLASATIYTVFHSLWNKLIPLSTVEMIVMFILIWTSSVFSFWAGEQRVEYKYKKLVILTVIVAIIQPAVGIIVIRIFNNKVTARLISMAIVEIIFYLGLYVGQIKRGEVFFSKQYWKYAVKFNIPLIPHYLSQTILNNADRLMIERMLGLGEAGIYSLAYSIALIMMLFNTALSQTLSPWIYKKIKEGKNKDIASVGYLGLLIVATVNYILILLAPEVVRIFAPAEYYDSIWAIPPVAISTLFIFGYDLFAKFAFYYEKTNFVMIVSILSAGLNVVLNYLFINKYGYIAAGYTTLVCYIMSTCGHYAFMRRICKKYCNGVYPFETIKLIMIGTGFVCLGLAVIPLYNYAIIRYTILTILVLLTVIFRKEIARRIKILIKIRSGA